MLKLTTGHMTWIRAALPEWLPQLQWTTDTSLSFLEREGLSHMTGLLRATLRPILQASLHGSEGKPRPGTDAGLPI